MKKRRKRRRKHAGEWNKAKKKGREMETMNEMMTEKRRVKKKKKRKERKRKKRKRKRKRVAKKERERVARRGVMTRRMEET